MGLLPRRHYVPHFNGCALGYACSSRSNGSKDSSYYARRRLRVDGQRYGAGPADTLEKRHGTGTTDALEKRHGTGTTDAVEERHGTGSANTLVRLPS